MNTKNTKGSKKILTTVLTAIIVLAAFSAMCSPVSAPTDEPPCTDGECPPPPCTNGDCPQEIAVDIKPGSCPNPINLGSKGVLPVAVLGTEDFDVTTIDPATIRLTRDAIGAVAPLRWSYEDVATPFTGELCGCHALNGDGYMDLSLKFDTQAVVMTLGLDAFVGQTIPLAITGNLKEEAGGTPIEGQDCIWVLKTGKK